MLAQRGAPIRAVTRALRDTASRVRVPPAAESAVTASPAVLKRLRRTSEHGPCGLRRPPLSWLCALLRCSARFFASGLVLSGMTLMDYVTNADRDRIETALLRSRHIGATSLRWNALLKGQELEWASGGSLYGLRPGCTRAVREVADMALAHGIKLQIVLGTAHFLRFGYGGPDNVLNGISNRERVRNIHSMMTNESGIAAFLERVIDPIAASLGGAVHPAVLGFLIVNEGYAMVRKDDKVFFDETDATLTLRELQRWVNRIAGRLHAKLPGTLLSASLKLRKHEPSMEREGKLNTAQWFEDAELIGAGGDPLGTLQLHQYQYYPETAYGPEASPFVNTASTLRAIHRASLKPMLAGEFPVEGLHVVPTSCHPRSNQCQRDAQYLYEEALQRTPSDQQAHAGAKDKRRTFWRAQVSPSSSMMTMMTSGGRSGRLEGPSIT